MVYISLPFSVHASNLIADGVNIVAVSKRLGHKDISVTLNTYTHLLEKNNEEMLMKLEKSSHNLLTIFSQTKINQNRVI